MDRNEYNKLRHLASLERRRRRREYKELLKSHDFLYYMSDDRRIYEVGLIREKKLIKDSIGDSVMVKLYELTKKKMLAKAGIK